MSVNQQPSNDEYWMSQALKLASKGIYTTTPNPRVGCVIVKNNQCVGQGYHQQAGQPHAEVHALREAGEHAKGATAYVTLEPCCHHGRTGPCTGALIDAGVTRVVAAMQDPNPEVAGNGFEKLKAADIEVSFPCLESEAQELNKGFCSRIQRQRPWVTIKLAQSLDGRTAMSSGESQWITGAAARQDVQYLRAQQCAIICGVDSVLIDDPSMTVRLSAEQLDVSSQHLRQPLRVIIDGQGRLTGREKLFQQAGDILVASCQPSLSFERDPQLGELQHWQSTSTDDGHMNAQKKVDLTELLMFLNDRCNYVLVESGAHLAGAFVASELCDELVLYCAPTLLGSEARPLLSLALTKMNQQIRWQWHDNRMVGDDLRLTLRPSVNNPNQHVSAH